MKIEQRRPRDRFPEEYVVDLNATKAAERAGFSKKTAYSQGQRLLKNVEIQKRVQKLQTERSERTQVSADRVLRELAIIANSDIQDFITIDDDTGAIRAKGFGEMPALASRALESITENRTVREDAEGEDSIINDKVTFRMHDKIRANELLGKHLGMFKDQPQEVKLSGTINVISAVPRPKAGAK